MSIFHVVRRFDGGSHESYAKMTCGHCGARVEAAVIARYPPSNASFLVCVGCGSGSVDNNGLLSPTVKMAFDVQGLPLDVASAYEEARRSIGAGAPTASELMCRKLLMHIAVEKGARAGETFAFYITHLESLGYVTPPMKGWVDLIRQHGNLSTHDLPPADLDRARSTLMFTAELLRLIYEMEHVAKQYAKP